MTEYDELVLDYQKIRHGNYLVEKRNMMTDCNMKLKKVNTMPLQLGAFDLNNSK